MTKARLTDKIALNMLAMAQQDLTCGQHEGHKMVWCNRCIKDERGQAHERFKGMTRERDEALAQVAALNNYYRPNEKLAGEIYAKAHALLDRLRRAEVVVEAVKGNHSLSGSECRESVTRCPICEALAAWEEGKA